MSAENEWKGKLKINLYNRLFFCVIEKLCGCTNDCGTCCYGYWCTPCLFGSNAEKIDDQNCVLMCGLYLILAQCSLCWIPHYVERQKLRKKYNLKEDPCHDCPTTACCGPCALCQEAREMKARGKL
jgi:Cys-rich protein (TIGR01571 family)